ncbi:MAG: sensor domain-containing diguanylate cyclase [Pseudomonadota bacterium]|nr:sensor domain-containing diguanylate cyclase [Pseudomonadota bacterium]
MIISLLPALIISIAFVYHSYTLDKERVNIEAIALVRHLSASLDKQLSETLSGLEVLATSRSLAVGELETFQAHAIRALPYQSATNFVLIDKQGQQLSNTLVPFGQSLPDTRKFMRFRRVFETGKPLVTDLFRGPATGKPTLAMAVPVFRGEEVIYALTAGLSPSSLSNITSGKNLPTGWTAVIVDGQGTIIARTREAERYIGQKAVQALLDHIRVQREGLLESVTKEGTPVFTAYTHSASSDWSIAVGVPKANVVGLLYEALFKVSAGALLVLFVGGALAGFLGRRVTAQVRQLIAPAEALGEGNAPPVLKTWLKEVHAVNGALEKASAKLVEAQQRANYDVITGLSRRVLFHELVAHQIAMAARHRSQFAILVIDLDNFKAVNDTHGHPAGDFVLKSAAERVLAAIRISDVAARLGGDEFAVLLNDIDLPGARIVAAKMCAEVGQPYADVVPRVSASIGIAVFPHDGGTVAALLENADNAMYQAKTAGKGRVAEASRA